MIPTDVLKFDPEAFITIDFETYYANDYSLSSKHLTPEGYIRDPQFQVIGVGVKVNDSDAGWYEEHEFREWARTIDWSRVAVLAHNGSGFDFFIMFWHYGIRAGFYFDSEDMARALYGAHGAITRIGLGALSKYHGVGEKGDEVVRAKGKRREDFADAEWQQYGVYCIGDCDLAKANFEVMLPLLPEVELWHIDTTVRMWTEPQLLLNSPFLTEYLVGERQRKADLLARIAQDKSILMSNDKFAALLVDYGVEPPMKVSLPKTKTARLKDPEAEPVMTYAFAKSDSGMQELLEHEVEEVRWLAEARVAVKSTINETRAERFLKLGAGNRLIPIPLRYAAAHTFRWSGRDKINAQNLERTNKRKPLKGAIRKALHAPDGHKVVVADSSAIEARMTAWLAGEEWLVEAFRQNQDPYNEFASVLYGRPIDRKHVKEDEGPGAVGKICVLGLGYGLGFIKLSQMMLAGPMGADPIQFTMDDAELMGVRVGAFFENDSKMERIREFPSRLGLEDLAIHCAVAEHLVQVYRRKNVAIKELWKAMNDEVLPWMLDETEEVTFGPNNCMTTTRHGLRLPNGVVMRYPGLKESDDHGYSYIGRYGKGHVHLYGGLMTENVIQALARIVVGDQMLMLRGKYGYQPALMTHDEIALVVPDAEVELAKARMLEEMRTPPPWAVGLPLNAECGAGQSYGSAK
jgi:DNA polymerase